MKRIACLVLAVLCALVVPVHPQLTPLLIGGDAYTPKLIRCNLPDTQSPFTTRCDQYRSSGCDLTTKHCLLADVLSASNTTEALITFTTTPYAAFMPSMNSGMLRVNLRYADGRFYQLSGVLQLWMLQPGQTNLYQFTGEQYEVKPAASVNAQTYYFYRIFGGTYVVVYWDDGGTQYALGVPEFSQKITIPNMFLTDVELQMFSLPLDTYNTNYRRANRNFITYQIYGPPGYEEVFQMACTDARYNVCPVWFYTTDQGNRNNAKFDLEPVPPAAAAAGFTDSLLKFKIFPIMGGSKRRKLTFALRYAGEYPLFPASYADIWNQRQRYGFVTPLVTKTLVYLRTYIDDQYGLVTNGPVSASWKQYQIRVSAGWNGTSSTLPFPACPWESAAMNTLTASDASTEVYMVNTMRRMYCECYTGFKCTLTVDYTDYQVSQAVRVGIESQTNNYDQYSDFKQLLDVWQYPLNSNRGDVSGRPFSLDYDFAPHDNLIAIWDFPCNPVQTYYTQAFSVDAPYPPLQYGPDANLVGQYATSSNGLAVFADLYYGKTDVQDFFSYNPGPGVDPCFAATSDAQQPPTSGQAQDMEFCQPGSDISSLWYVDEPPGTGSYGLPQYGSFTQSLCNCLSRNGFHWYGNYSRPEDMSNYWQFDYPAYDQCNYRDYLIFTTVMCCNKAAQSKTQTRLPHTLYFWTVFVVNTYIPQFSGGVTQYLNTDFHGNGAADMFATNGDQLCGITPGESNPGMTYFSANGNYDNIMPNALRWDGLECACATCGPGACPGSCTCPGAGPYKYAWCRPTFGDSCLMYVPTAAPARSIFTTQYTFMQSFSNMFVFNSGTVNQATPFYMLFVDRDGSIVFGTYGLDTFPVVTDTNFTIFNDILDDQSPYEAFFVRGMIPTYARYKVVPEIEFYGFSNIDAPPAGGASIYITFRVSCPNVNMNTANDGTVGMVGFCAQNWYIVNQANVNVLISVLSVAPPSTVSEPVVITAAIPYGLSVTQPLPDVLEAAELTLKIQYNDGDVLSFLFFPKYEPESPQGVGVCGNAYVNAISGLMRSAWSMQVPQYFRTMVPMTASIDSVQPACEGNPYEMLLSVVGGEPFVMQSAVALNLPRYDIVGSDGPALSYWIVWDINGTRVEGFAVGAQLYEDGSVASVYDRYGHVTGLIPPLPSPNVTYPNPLVRPVWCDNTNATCYVPASTTNTSGSNIQFSGIDQNPYWDGANHNLLVARLVFAYPYTFENSVGAVYFNLTTAYIDVFIQEQQDRAIFEMQLEYDANLTAYYTMTVRYGVSVPGVIHNYPCFERLITYAIILTDFMAEPGQIQRIAGCDRADNCCYFLPINVFGNTLETENIVNLATQCNQTTQLECAYEIIITPPPANQTATSYGGLCPGQSYTFTIQSPEAAVRNRKQATLGNYFEYAWRGPATYELTLPRVGFNPVTLQTFNGDCATRGSFAEVTTTFVDFVCNGPITDANPVPDCAYNLLLAVVATNAPGWNPAVGGSLNNPFLLGPANAYGAFVATYNIAFVLDLPQVFGTAAGRASLPNGVYQIYLWISPAGVYPYVSYANALAAFPYHGIQTQMSVVFDVNDGMSVVRNAFTIPRCPATFNQTRDDPPASWSMNLKFTVYDQVWRGPYLFQLFAPDGTRLDFTWIYANSTLGCAVPCSGLLEPNSTGYCPACDIYIRDTGIPYTFLVGTGVVSPNQQGQYMIFVDSIPSSCTAQYLETIVPLNTLSAQISCARPTCYGAQNGVVRGYPAGGTMRPILQSDLGQGSDLTVAVLRYYVSVIYVPGALANGSQIVYPNTTIVPFAAQGYYTFNLTDFNDCFAEASCYLEPVFEPLVLELVGVNEPNCSTQYGEATFAVANRTILPQEMPLTLFAIGPDQHPVDTGDGYLLTDTSVHPGLAYLYTVCTALMCCAAPVNLTINAAETLTVVIFAEQLPCAGGSGTGILNTIVEPPGQGAHFAWTYNGIPLAVDSGRLTGAQTGLYTVTVTTVTGCTAFDSFSLASTASLSVVIERTAPEITPATVNGVMYGGNGPPYTVTVSPQNISELVIINVTNATPFTPELSYFFIFNVPPAATILITVTDHVGCAVRVTSYGTNTHVPPVPVSPSPTPMPKFRPPNFQGFFIVVGCVLGIFVFIFCLLFTSYAWESSRRRFHRERGGALKSE